MGDLNRTDREVLRALRDAQGRADTSEIRDWISDHRGEDMTNSNVGKRAKRMVDMGLVEIDGERDVGAPLPANVYALTELGAETAADLAASRDRTVTVGASAERVDDLEETVKELADSVAQFEDAVQTLDERTRRLYELSRAEDSANTS